MAISPTRDAMKRAHEYRLLHRCSQAEAARLHNISQGALSDYERRCVPDERRIDGRKLRGGK